MRAYIYLNERKDENLLVEVDVEVCPRGIYEIDGKPYQVIDQPRFVISSGDSRNPGELRYVELIAEEYNPNKPKVFRGPA